MSIPLFSVIIPTYNSGETIINCLNSIIFQSLQDFEILVIDGDSNDDTIEKTLSFADERIRVKTEKDRGVYDAMNKGIKLAKGKFLYFIGGDDQLHSNDIFKKISFEAQNRSFNVLYGNSLIVGDTPWAKSGSIYDGVFNLKKLLTKNICHQSVFYNRNFVKTKIGFFNLKYKICSDWDFNLRCWSKSSFVYCNEIIADFYNGGKSTTSLFDETLAKDFFNNIVKYFPLSTLELVLPEDHFNYCDTLKKNRNKKYITVIKQTLKNSLFKKNLL